VYVITHRLADVDAYCSAYATANLLRSITRSNVNVVLPEGLNTIAEQVSKTFPMSIDSSPNFAKADLIAIVDTNNPLLLSQMKDEIITSKARKVLIDHHPMAKNGEKLANAKFVDTRASSASELVYRLYKENKVKMSKQIAQVLLVGIMADSQHLFLASSKTIEAVNDLCKCGASLELAKKVLTHERDPSERIARLKAAQRVSVYSANSFIAAFSRVGSFQASAARALLDLGADVAIVVGGDEKASKASLRATQKFYNESKLHLGTDIAGKLTDLGGGHPTAASLSVKVGEDELAKMLMNAIEAKLGKLNMIK
ncbi:MAG TPA: DHH family phosphoesterase, partial [Nitrososphaerales archaeon]|nr:DHH family phosphoesterase [Nitrososphaerales archaeon]